MKQDYNVRGCPEWPTCQCQPRGCIRQELAGQPLPSSQCTLTLREFIISLKPMEIRMPPGKQNWITFHQTKQIQSSAIKAKFSATREDPLKYISSHCVECASEKQELSSVSTCSKSSPPQVFWHIFSILLRRVGSSLQIF